MSLQAPKQQPWMLILKASCMEDILPAHHPKYYGMKVVGVSKGGTPSLASPQGGEISEMKEEIDHNFKRNGSDNCCHE